MGTISDSAGRTGGVAVRPKLQEAGGVLIVLLGVCLFLSLASYDPTDPSWNVDTARTRAFNYIGPVGSHLADGALQSFGLVSFAIPPLLLLFGYLRFRSKFVPALVMRAVGWLALMLCLAGLLALFTPEGFYLRESIRPGGFVGWVLAQQLELRLNPVGTGLVLTSFSMLFLMLAANISYIESARKIQTGIAGIWGHLSWTKPDEELRVTPEEEKPSSARKQGKARANSIETDLGSEAGFPLLDDYEDYEQLPLIRMGSQMDDPELPESLGGKSSRSRVSALADGGPDPRSRLDAARTSQTERPSPVGVVLGRAGAGTAPAALIDLDEEEEDAEIAEMLSTASVRRVVKPNAAGSRTSGGAPAARRPRLIPGEYVLPSSTMLSEPQPSVQGSGDGQEALLQVAHQLAAKCKEFAVAGHVQQISPGPVVTTFEFKPDPGIKYSRITSLVDDLCLALEAESIRIDRIPGKSTVGIEVPNRNREIISLREIIESRKFQESKSKLTIALGKTIDGSIYVADLAKMPHLLIAGSTGAGKSVTVNSVIVSMLMNASPEDVRFILIDPKRLELGLYQDIPHLLVPIVTDAKRASYALKWAVAEMEKRYRQLAGFGVRNIEQFNRELKDRGVREMIGENGEPVGKLPYLVIMIDELADLMMVASNDVETSITRLAQMARAVGIHLVLTTQRPSVDVITGLIKANFPCRVAFRVSSKVDSRTIIDANGAEQLLGKGDMLFLPPGTARLIRVHGAFVDEKEIKRMVDFIKEQGEPTYDETVLLSEKEAEQTESGSGRRDELFEEALRIVIHMGRASTSVLQRRLRIGYGRAAAIIDMMEREGFVEPADGTRPRAITSKAAEFRERLQQLKEAEA